MSNLKKNIQNKFSLKMVVWLLSKLKVLAIYLCSSRKTNPRSWKEILVILIIVPIIYYVGIVYYTNLNKSCAYSFNKALGDPAYNRDVRKKWTRLEDICIASVAEEFDPQELYAQYRLLRHIDENILSEENKDDMKKSYYYRWLFFAHLYDDNNHAEELEELESTMSNEEKYRAFYGTTLGYTSNKTSHQEIYGYFKMKEHMNKNVFKSQEHMSYPAEHHKYLYYANIHGNGIYSKELQEFENSMTRNEKMEAFGVLGTILTNPDFLKYIKRFDYDKAFELVQISAKLGDAGSQLILGGAYATGKFLEKKDMPINLILAYKWVYLSFYLGREKSKPGLEIIKRAIIHRKIPNGIEQGQALADEWIEQNKEWLKTRNLKS